METVTFLWSRLLTIAQPWRGRGWGHSPTDLHSSQLGSHLCTCRGRAIGLKHSWLADHRGQWGWPKWLRPREPVKRRKAVMTSGLGHPSKLTRTLYHTGNYIVLQYLILILGSFMASYFHVFVDKLHSWWSTLWLFMTSLVCGSLHKPSIPRSNIIYSAI